MMPITPRIDGLRDIERPITEEHTSGTDTTTRISQAAVRFGSLWALATCIFFHGHQAQKI
jgi:hypothetical protein